MGLTAWACAVTAAIGICDTGDRQLAAAAMVDRRPAVQAEVIQVRTRLPRNLEQRTIRIGDRERTYYLYVPQSADQGRAPLVVAFHGGGGNPLGFARRTGLREMADRYGFVMALPEGLGGFGRGGSWNAGSNPPSGYAEKNGVDDLGFVARLLDEVTATGSVDPSRVYAMGVSKGGMMTYWAACNLPGRFAAIAVVAGTLSSGRCADPGGTSLLHIHGTADENVPFEGGRGDNTSPGSSWASALDGILQFARQSACSPNWTSTQVAPDTTCQEVSCPGSDEVEYCLIQGGGHGWPGAQPTKRQKQDDVYHSPYFDTTAVIAQFFLSH